MADEKEPAADKSPVVSTGAAVSATSGHAVVIAQPRAELDLMPKVSRRGVVRVAFWGGLGAMLLGIVVTIINSLVPRGVTGFGSKIFVGTVDQLEAGKPIKNIEAKAWLVKLDATTAQRNGGQEGAILALYQKCPHLGCTVPWRPDYSREDPRSGQSYAGWYLCPCHGSTYSMAGVRVFGPAPRSMDTFGITIDGGKITVDTGKITQGTTENASRGVLPG